MAIADPTKQYVVRTDASRDGLGAVLLQEDETGKLRPVAYASRRTTVSEQNYKAYELEALGVVWAVQYWEHYLASRAFRLQTDHQALQWLLDKTDLRGRLARWVGNGADAILVHRGVSARKGECYGRRAIAAV